MCELNSDVNGDHLYDVGLFSLFFLKPNQSNLFALKDNLFIIKKSIDRVLENRPDYLKSFNLVIATNLREKCVLKSLKRFLNSLKLFTSTVFQVPLKIWPHTYGMKMCLYF